MTDWTPDVVLELRSQGVSVEIVTPQDGSWCVEDRYILTTKEMQHLKAHGKLNLEGVKDLHRLRLDYSKLDESELS